MNLINSVLCLNTVFGLKWTKYAGKIVCCFGKNNPFALLVSLALITFLTCVSQTSYFCIGSFYHMLLLPSIMCLALKTFRLSAQSLINAHQKRDECLCVSEREN